MGGLLANIAKSRMTPLKYIFDSQCTVESIKRIVNSKHTSRKCDNKITLLFPHSSVALFILSRLIVIALCTLPLAVYNVMRNL